MNKDNKDFLNEEKYLNIVNEVIDKEIASLNIELKEIPKKHTNVLQGDAYLVESLMSQCATRIHSLENASDSPYFGKFTFIDEDGAEKEYCIGRTFLKNSETEALITDWRAPISSIFYTYGIGPAEYEAPIGKINGNITQKKQIIINNKKLDKIFDTNFASNDEILQSYLNTHANDKIKDIIASIQKEQNDIIRLPLNNNIIVQGIAGSGKTSIALHRLAYLIYTLKENNSKSNINSNQFLIIGPNDCFLDYISEVLPSMDIDNVVQKSYKSLISDEINSKYKIIDNNEILDLINHNKDIQNVSNYKNSIEYIDLVKTFVDGYIDTVFNKDFIINDTTLIKGDSFKNRLALFKSDLNTSIKEMKKFYVNSIKENYVDWEFKLTNDLRQKAKSIPEGHETRKIIYDLIQDLRAQCKTGFKKEIDKYFAPLLFNPVDIYKIFIETLDDNDQNLRNIKTHTLELLKKKKISRDDLAAIMYIKSRISGFDSNNKILHVIIDEAQDYSKMELELLKKMFPKATFSIFGDLSQSIYQYRSIQSWDDISTSIFDTNNIYRINKSYRTTDEIIKEADKISSLLNNEISLENVRHGSSVDYYCLNIKDKIQFIKNKIINASNNNYKSIAIICKNEEEVINLQKKLSDIANINVISSTNNEFHGGICIISAALSKGLEFDYVIIYNADKTIYQINDRNDLALLYVAMTRALHKLDVIYENELIDALKNPFKSEKNLSLKK